MAHKKAGSSSKNGRDSVGQRLGVKAGDGQLVHAGSIIVRQRGMTFLAGSGAGLGHDYTVFATVNGHVRFEHATKTKKRVRVLPLEIAGGAAKAPKATERHAATERRAATTDAAPSTGGSTGGTTATAIATTTATTNDADATKSTKTTRTAATAAKPKTTTAKSKATAEPEATAD